MRNLMILGIGVTLVVVTAAYGQTAQETAARAQLQQARIDAALAVQDLQNQAAQASADIGAAQMRSQQIQMEQAADAAKRRNAANPGEQHQ